MAGIKSVFGGGAFAFGRGFKGDEDAAKVLDVLEKGGVSIIDTAALYGESEAIIGRVGTGKRFTIDTKTRGGFGEDGATSAFVQKEAAESQQKLNSTVDVFYIHAPDVKTPLEDTLAGVQAVYQTGFFKRFGLSNYKAEDVQKVYDLCKAKGYVLPTVYQGNYSAVARKQEDVLFPTLRKLGIAFYAYSPSAGGFLTKSKEQVLGGSGRFNSGDSQIGNMYTGMYGKESYYEALTQWEEIAKDEGCTKAALAYRWVKYNSALKPENGDAIIFGAATFEQLDETLETLGNGPLSESAVKRIDGVWEKIKDEAPLDNYNG